ncbi:MAG: bifunctional nuclease domain-containing protein [Acidimicrobiales bacterium]|jgi:bifunctional DNase/RNase
MPEPTSTTERPVAGAGTGAVAGADPDPLVAPTPVDPDPLLAPAPADPDPLVAPTPADPDPLVDPVPEVPEPVVTPPPVGPVDFRMVLVSSVTLDLPNQHPSVVLREIETPRRQLTFAIGMQDAVALSHALRRIPTPRPLTHELMSGVLQRFDIDLVAVRIVGRSGAVHFAELDLRGVGGRSVHSCRPSDALTLALHQPVPVPILVDARLLEGPGDVAPPGADD